MASPEILVVRAFIQGQLRGRVFWVGGGFFFDWLGLADSRKAVLEVLEVFVDGAEECGREL